MNQEKIQKIKSKLGACLGIFKKMGRSSFSRKVWFSLAGVFLVLALGLALSKVFFWRVDVFVEKMEYQKYSHIAPDFSFSYSDQYVFDSNEGNKYGNDYLGGFRLKSDQRTGCDIRSNPVGINFKKSEQEIRDALQKEFSVKVKDFKMIDGRFSKIDGESAFVLEFSFTDPVGATLRLNQVMVSHGGADYLLVCGTGDYQYKYLRKDFEHFFDSFRWGSVI